MNSYPADPIRGRRRETPRTKRGESSSSLGRLKGAGSRGCPRSARPLPAAGAAADESRGPHTHTHAWPCGRRAKSARMTIRPLVGRGNNMGAEERAPPAKLGDLSGEVRHLSARTWSATAPVVGRSAPRAPSQVPVGRSGKNRGSPSPRARRRRRCARASMRLLRRSKASWGRRGGSPRGSHPATPSRTIWGRREPIDAR